MTNPVSILLIFCHFGGLNAELKFFDGLTYEQLEDVTHQLSNTCSASAAGQVDCFRDDCQSLCDQSVHTSGVNLCSKSELSFTVATSVKTCILYKYVELISGSDTFYWIYQNDESTADACRRLCETFSVCNHHTFIATPSNECRLYSSDPRAQIDITGVPPPQPNQNIPDVSTCSADSNIVERSQNYYEFHCFADVTFEQNAIDVQLIGDSDIQECMAINSENQLFAFTKASYFTAKPEMTDYTLSAVSLFKSTIRTDSVTQFAHSKITFTGQIRNANFDYEQTRGSELAFAYTNLVAEGLNYDLHEYFNSFAVTPNCTFTDLVPLSDDPLERHGQTTVTDIYMDQLKTSFEGTLNPVPFEYSAQLLDTEQISYDRNLLTYRINTELVPIFQAAQSDGSEFVTYDIALSQDSTDATKVHAVFTLTYQALSNTTGITTGDMVGITSQLKTNIPVESAKSTSVLGEYDSTLAYTKVNGRRLPYEVWLWNLITVTVSCGFGLLVIIIIAGVVAKAVSDIEKASTVPVYAPDNIDIYSAEATTGNFTQTSVRA